MKKRAFAWEQPIGLLGLILLCIGSYTGLIKALAPILLACLVTRPAAAQLDRGQPASADEALALGADVQRTVGAPEGPPLGGNALQQRTDELSSRMRCPVCQGHAIVDSPSETARNLKRQVRAMVAAGFTEDQIFRYFEASYGEFIRLMPRAQGFNLLVWIIPAVALLLGVAVVWRLIRPRRPDPQGSAAETTPIESFETDRESSAAAQEDPWIARVRKEVKDEP